MVQFDNHKIVGEIGKLLNRLGNPALDFSTSKESLVLDKLQEINAILDEQFEVVDELEIQQESQLSIDNSTDVPKKEYSAFEPNENMTNCDFSAKLQKYVSDIKNQIIVPVPISEKLARHIQEHDQIRCVGHIANEDLWNGASGIKPISAYWSMTSCLWKNAPDFFEEFDKDRAISEYSEDWNQKYFDEQRNFLRHNFSLERLCHIIMVHEKIHNISEEIPVRPKPTVIVETKRPFGDAPASTENNSASSMGRKKLFFIGSSVIVILLLVIGAIIIYKQKPIPENNNKMPIGRRTIKNNAHQSSRRIPKDSEDPKSTKERIPSSISRGENK